MNQVAQNEWLQITCCLDLRFEAHIVNLTFGHDLYTLKAYQFLLDLKYFRLLNKQLALGPSICVLRDCT